MSALEHAEEASDTEEAERLGRCAEQLSKAMAAKPATPEQQAAAEKRESAQE